MIRQGLQEVAGDPKISPHTPPCILELSLGGDKPRGEGVAVEEGGKEQEEEEEGGAGGGEEGGRLHGGE